MNKNDPVFRDDEGDALVREFVGHFSEAGDSLYIKIQSELGSDDAKNDAA